MPLVAFIFASTLSPSFPSPQRQTSDWGLSGNNGGKPKHDDITLHYSAQWLAGSAINELIKRN